MERVFRYLLYMLPGCCIAAAAFFPVRRRVKGGVLRRIAMLLFWIFTGGMAVITLTPEPGWLFTGLVHGYWHAYFDFSHLACRVSLIPLSQLDNLFNIIGNIVMFLPFGFFAALLWWGWNWKRALALGLGITGFIECWQILVGRYFDIDDIILNTLGVFCGYLLWRLLKRFAPKLVEKFHVNEETA